MKCSICGSELEYGSNICKYCGNVEKLPEPELLPEEPTDYTRIYNIPAAQNNEPEPVKQEDEAEAAEPVQKEEQPEEQNIPAGGEDDMSNRKANTQKGKKKHPVRTAVIMVLAMMVIFAITFSIFFHLLGGSFKNEEEPTDTPAPTETLPAAATEQSIATKAPTEKPAAPTKAPQKPTEVPVETKEPEPEATEDTRTSDYLFNSSRNVIRQSELEARTREEIKLIYYEIYARHGYDFQDAELKEYFSGKTWYEPVTSHREAAEAEFNVVERENIEIIEAYQREKGWRQ